VIQAARAHGFATVATERNWRRGTSCMGPTSLTGSAGMRLRQVVIDFGTIFLGRDYILFFDVSRHKKSRLSTNTIALNASRHVDSTRGSQLNYCPRWWWPCDVKHTYRTSCMTWPMALPAMPGAVFWRPAEQRDPLPDGKSSRSLPPRGFR